MIHALYSRDGVFVASVFVPLIFPQIEVVIWNGRVFAWSALYNNYREAIAIHLPV